MTQVLCAHCAGPATYCEPNPALGPATEGASADSAAPLLALSSCSARTRLSSTCKAFTVRTCLRQVNDTSKPVGVMYEYNLLVMTPAKGCNRRLQQPPTICPGEPTEILSKPPVRTD